MLKTGLKRKKAASVSYELDGLKHSGYIRRIKEQGTLIDRIRHRRTGMT